jgi:hypothetical protein
VNALSGSRDRSVIKFDTQAMAGRPSSSSTDGVDLMQHVPSKPSDSTELIVPREVWTNLSASSTDLRKFPLSIDDQKAMASKVEAIFELEEMDEPSVDLDMDDGETEDKDTEQIVDLQDQQRRTEKLKSILPTLGQLWWAASEEIDVVTERLADGSRDRELNPHNMTIFLFTSPDCLVVFTMIVLQSLCIIC